MGFYVRGKERDGMFYNISLNKSIKNILFLFPESIFSSYVQKYSLVDVIDAIICYAMFGP